MSAWHIQTVSSRVENSAQVSSCQVKFDQAVIYKCKIIYRVDFSRDGVGVSWCQKISSLDVFNTPVRRCLHYMSHSD